jgi:hypothetical protein
LHCDIIQHNQGNSSGLKDNPHHCFILDNIMSDLVQLMQAWFQRLLIDFETTFSAEQVTHPGERGRLLEETLRSFLSSSLPNREALENCILPELDLQSVR